MPLLLKNALCFTLSPSIIESVDLRISGGTITARAKSIAAREGETVVDLMGNVVIPGLVCAHTHLYSSLARGMPAPERPPQNFPDILETVWWRLDRALDTETVHQSALAGAAEAVRCGVTTIVDHHSSPNAISGSLSAIKQALGEIGIRGILCYETSDRDGSLRRDLCLQENEEFLRDNRSHETVRGLVGAHASFTLSDESLKRLGDIVERCDSGIHIHLAEDRSDQERTRHEFGRGIIERLNGYGLLRRKSLFAHCIHLSDQEFSALRSSRAWLIHNPRSNMNNNVGHAPLGKFGDRAALGTDGFPHDMFEELRVAFLRNQESEEKITNDEILRLLQNGRQLASEVFEKPFGSLTAGSVADLVVLDYNSPTPLLAENLASHALFGFRSSMVKSVMVAGKWVLHNGVFEHLDERGMLNSAQEAARKLWSRMHDIRA